MIVVTVPNLIIFLVISYLTPGSNLEFIHNPNPNLNPYPNPNNNINPNPVINPYLKKYIYNKSC